MKFFDDQGEVMSDNPYKMLGENSFWKTAVAQKSMFDIKEIWHSKFNIRPSQKVATYGSCFAQHIGRALKERGFNWLITEPGPEGVSEEKKKLFNYEIFSSRTGNIYTTSLLRQWVEWASGNEKVPEEVWESEGRWYDPFRPAIEPNGFSSKEEMFLSRRQTIEAFYQSIKQSDVFVFTLGLTESWFSKDGYEYPMCPGTVAGEFNESCHKFKNQGFNYIKKNLEMSMEIMREINPRLKFILTVSPVPLTASNSGMHVLVATMESKSILRSVAGAIAKRRPYVDYFPSYELINSPVFKGTFFEPNQRNVNPYGVNFVMEKFFEGLKYKGSNENKTRKSLPPATKQKEQSNRDEVCEEELLGAFGGSK